MRLAQTPVQQERDGKQYTLHAYAMRNFQPGLNCRSSDALTVSVFLQEAGQQVLLPDYTLSALWVVYEQEMWLPVFHSGQNWAEGGPKWPVERPYLVIVAHFKGPNGQMIRLKKEAIRILGPA
ncbi:MAG: hypothetical protein ACO1RX_08855 [Candidatus Sericytochromatia bacterium]